MSHRTDPHRSQIRETTLPNGVRVLSEEIPSVRSVAAGIWVRQGSVHEEAEEMGVSHLLEHMLFKGTESRSALDIALALESLGGSLDAYTSREHTSYQARVLDEHLPYAIDVLCDMVVHPRLDPNDLELEREVVLEEISTVEDTPDDLVFELHGSRLWGGHPYGHSILGTRETVSEMSVDALRRLHSERYRGSNLIVAAAGRLDHDALVSEVARHLGDVPDTDSAPSVAEPNGLEVGDDRVERDSAQTHIVFGTAVPGRSDDVRYPLVLLSAAFGGGMSSRLFQRVREELALAYAVYSFQSFYSRRGISGVYVGTRPSAGDRAVDVIREEMRRVAEEGLGQQELHQAKQQVKGQLMLSLESTSSRLYRLAGFPLYDEPFLTLDEVLAKIDGVTSEEIHSTALRYFHPDRQYVLRLGPAGAGVLHN